MADVPINSKYVRGGFVRTHTDGNEEYIAEMMAETEEKGTYTRYDGPLLITGKDGNIIPVPTENKGRYKYEDQETEQPEHIKEAWSTDGNLFNIEATNGTGLIRRGMHIRYVRKSPRNFVKGGFVNHINSTYIAFRYAKGSSVVQLSDIDHLYVDNIIGKKKKKDVPTIEVKVIGQRGGAPPIERKKVTVISKTLPVLPIKQGFTDPLTGKEFRDAAHLRQFTSSKKYAKLIEQSAGAESLFDPTLSCPQCLRRFRDSYSLKRHMNSDKYYSGNCL